MKKSMIIITSLLAVALLSTSAFSWNHGGGAGCNGKGQGYGTNGNNPINDLTPEQNNELMALKQKFIDETYKTRSAMMTKHQEMRMLMETSSPDRAELEAIVTEINDLRSQLQIKRIDFQLAAKKIAPKLTGFSMGGRGGYGNKGGSANCPGQAQSGNCPRQQAQGNNQ
jgi:zinc resistance-associated protein